MRSSRKRVDLLSYESKTNDKRRKTTGWGKKFGWDVNALKNDKCLESQKTVHDYLTFVQFSRVHNRKSLTNSLQYGISRSNFFQPSSCIRVNLLLYALKPTEILGQCNGGVAEKIMTGTCVCCDS